MRNYDEGFSPVRIAAYAGIAVVGVVGLVTILGSFYTVDQGERAVVLRMGAVVGEAGPGLHFKAPWINSVATFDLRPQTRTYRGAFNAYSRDQQTAALQLSVNYHVVDATRTYSEYGNSDNFAVRVIDRQLPNVAENVFGQFDAVATVQRRAELTAALDAALKARAVGSPIQIDSLQLENVDFDDSYENNIRALMQATVQQRQAEAEQIRNKTQADTKAYELTTGATADAVAIKLRGEAEAAAIQARGDALRNNPGLVQLQAVEKWNGQLPAQMIPGSALPFVNLTGGNLR